MAISSTWTALTVVFALLYASKDHFQITKHVQEMSRSGSGGKTPDNDIFQLTTGFIQAKAISIRAPAIDDHEETTHVLSISLDDLAPLASFFTPASTGVVHVMASTRNFFQDYAELAAIAQARLAAEPTIAAALAPDHQFVHTCLPFMTSDVNKRTPGNISALAHQVPLERLLGAVSSMMVSMSGCNATAVADLIKVTVDDTKVELRVRMVDNPHIMSEFEPHPKQVFHGADNHYHFETVPGVVPDAKAFIEFSQSPAALGAAVGIFLKGCKRAIAGQLIDPCAPSPPPPSPPSPPPPSPPPATSTSVILLPASGFAIGPLGVALVVVGSTAQLTVRVTTNGPVSILFRTNGVPAPSGGTTRGTTTGSTGGTTTGTTVATSSSTEDVAITTEPQYASTVEPDATASGHADDAAASSAATLDAVASDAVEAQGGSVTTQWWLFPPFGPKFKTTPIFYNPNPLVVSASGTYSVSVFFQKAGIYRVDAVNARTGRSVTPRPLKVQVKFASHG